jgi:hypothetical protein
MRSSSGRSVSARRECHGWNSTVDICTAQTTQASSVTHSSSAVRPDGNLTSTVSSHGGAPLGTRFWYTFSPSVPSGKRCSMQGRSYSARTMPSPTDR